MRWLSGYVNKQNFSIKDGEHVVCGPLKNNAEENITVKSDCYRSIITNIWCMKLKLTHIASIKGFIAKHFGELIILRLGSVEWTPTAFWYQPSVFILSFFRFMPWSKTAQLSFVTYHSIYSKESVKSRLKRWSIWEVAKTNIL